MWSNIYMYNTWVNQTSWRMFSRMKVWGDNHTVAKHRYLSQSNNHTYRLVTIIQRPIKCSNLNLLLLASHSRDFMRILWAGHKFFQYIVLGYSILQQPTKELLEPSRRDAIYERIRKCVVSFRAQPAQLVVTIRDTMMVERSAESFVAFVSVHTFLHTFFAWRNTERRLSQNSSLRIPPSLPYLPVTFSHKPTNRISLIQFWPFAPTRIIICISSYICLPTRHWVSELHESKSLLNLLQLRSGRGHTTTIGSFSHSSIWWRADTMFVAENIYLDIRIEYGEVRHLHIHL